MLETRGKELREEAKRRRDRASRKLREDEALAAKTVSEHSLQQAHREAQRIAQHGRTQQGGTQVHTLTANFPQSSPA